MEDWNRPCFRLNRVVPLDEGLALVQWVEVETAGRLPWQHSIVCAADIAAEEAEMSGLTRSYQQVLDRAQQVEARDITIEDMEQLTEAPTRFYPELQGSGGWW
jgi:hypothetical protein